MASERISWTSALVPAYMITCRTDMGMPGAFITNVFNVQSFNMYFPHPKSLFHLPREGENGVEGKGWCKSSALGGASREEK